MKNTSQNKKVNIKPLGDRVLVRPIDQQEKQKTKSSIFIPDTIQKEKSGEGEVIAVGEGRYENGVLIPVRVNVGDTVMYSKYSYEEIKVDGKEYLILKEDTIMAIIN